MTVARSCGRVNTQIGVEGFQELVCGGMDSCLCQTGCPRPMYSGPVSSLLYTMYRSQGQDADRPHDASPPTGDGTGPLSASDEGVPFILVREWQSEAPHCGSHAAYRKLSPWSPPRSRYYCVPLATVLTLLATTHLASHTQTQP